MNRLRDLIARVRLFYDPTREPLRRRVYTALTLIITASVGIGVLTGAAAVTITGIAFSVLMGAVAEQIRTVVTPAADPVPLKPGQHAL